MNQVQLQQLKRNRIWYLLLGIGLIVLGTLAIYYALTATLISIIYLGFLLTIAGIFEGVKSVYMRTMSKFFLHVFLAVLYVAAGLFIIANPTVNALSLTLMLAIFFVISGAAKIIFSLLYAIPHKGWVLLNGLITLILGILIWAQWPASGLWVIGMFVGIDLIFTGWTWIMLSMLAKNIKISE